MKIIERDALIALGFDYATADNLSALTEDTVQGHEGDFDVEPEKLSAKLALVGQLAVADAIMRLAKALEAYVEVAAAGR